MKSLKKQARQIRASQDHARVQAPVHPQRATINPEKAPAQCCAKLSNTVAGCHD